MRRSLITLCALSAWLLAATAAAQEAGDPKKAGGKLRPEMLVSTAWLAEHLKDPDLVVLHVADTLGDYKRGHIPGARFLSQKRFAPDAGDLSTELPAPETLRALFSELGLSDETRVVIYATNWMPNAARAYFTLDYVGYGERAALLDGGVEQWVTEDRPVSGETPKFAPGKFTLRVNESTRALSAQVKALTEAAPAAADAQIVDTRPGRRYSAGHIAGATNIYWQDTLVGEETPLFLAPDKLRALYAQRGIVPGKKIITYCEVGMQASHGYFLAKYLGYDAAMFDGSFQEWNTLKKLPVVTGDSKR